MRRRVGPRGGSHRGLRVWALLALLTLAACASRPPTRGGPPAGPAQPVPSVPTATTPPVLTPPEVARFTPPPGWEAEDHAAAYAAYRETCRGGRACEDARRYGPLDREAARAFFETRFRAAAYPGEGLLTGYFTPVYPARASRSPVFDMPLLAPPEEGGQRAAALALDRAAIAARPPAGATVLAWLRAEDLFFLQIQGSGVLALPDGRRLKARFAAANAFPFTGVARPLREQGLLADQNTSGDAIRRWLADNRGPAAQAIMNLNRRYIFFRVAEDDGRNPRGAADVELPSGRAVAVDPAQHAYGELLWLEAEAPVLAGAFPAYRRLVTALDTGSAIRGPIRADLYVGQGDAAGVEAGRIRHRLRLWRLVPLEP